MNKAMIRKNLSTEDRGNEIFRADTNSDSPTLEFSRLISLERSLNWDTAKKFWSEKSEILRCSYNRYVVVENGSAKAGLELAKRIIRALEIAEDTGLYAWVRDLMPDERSRACFPDPNSYEKIARTPVLYLDKARMKLFNDEAFAFEMACYLSMYTSRGVSEDELREVFRVSKGQVRDLLNLLMHRGVVTKNSKENYTVPDEAWIQLPDLQEIRSLKSRAFSQTIESHFSQDFCEKETIEYSFMRLLCSDQVDKIRTKSKALTSWIGMLPDEPEAKPYNTSAIGNLATLGGLRKRLFKRSREIRGVSAK